jgi:hypothetical protein
MTTTVKFYEIPNHIKGLEFDGDKTDFRLHLSDQIWWSAKNRTEYNRIEKRISKAQISGIGWDAYAWCDVSGFDYWKEENNYVQISVCFESEEISIEEMDKMNDAINELYQSFDDLTTIF